MNKYLALLPILVAVLFSNVTYGQRKARLGKVCGDPVTACRTRSNFQPYELPFDYGKNNIIANSEFFYAIILKSVTLKTGANCETAMSEDERITTQKLFPRNKVFALKCFEPGLNYYTNVADDVSFLAVYAGRTRAEATKFLSTVKLNRNFSNVSLRRMQIGINGT